MRIERDDDGEFAAEDAQIQALIDGRREARARGARQECADDLARDLADAAREAREARS